MVRIQCLADGKLITYRVALTSLSVLEFLFKALKIQAVGSLAPTQHAFVTCKLHYLVVILAPHSTPVLQSHHILLASYKVSQALTYLNSLPDSEGFKYCG